MRTVVGVSAFGLQDCVASPDASCHELGFYPTSAMLPMNPFARILTGDEAHRERTHAGLEWPLEARILPGEPVRRSPISAVWRALVEAGDRIARWDAGRGVSFSLARILASHIKALVAGSLPNESRLAPGRGEAKLPTSVIAIPNHLDEFGQELLLRELAALECPETMLVWRPVAAALSWLDKVEGDFPRHMGENDHIHVVYLGPDALEFTTLRLRVREHQNRYYVLPLRDRPRGPLPLTGMDWAGVLIEQCFQGIDEGAFWQAFIQFPEIWQALAGIQWSPDDLPRPWNRRQRWTLWSPEPDIRLGAYDIKANSSDTLQRILERSCKLDSYPGEPAATVGEVLLKELRHRARLFPGGRLRGMIVCGPLAPRTIPPWLASDLEMLTARGLNIDGDLSEAEVQRLWLCSDCDDPVSEGAVIYGQKSLAKIPSYLDTMPQISILANERGRLTWVPLLKAEEVLGGEEHKDRIERRFQLQAGKRNLHIYLYKGSPDEAPNGYQDPFDPQMLPYKGLTPCRARLVRELVRRCGSLNAVEGRDFFRGVTQEAQYGRAFAQGLFTKTGKLNREFQTPSDAEIPRTALRRAVLDFPSAPEQDTVLNIEVRMRPASGVAKVEILPENASFLQGERVRLDYSRMHGTVNLPKRSRGWPRTEEIVVDPEDYVLHSREMWINTFERTSAIANDYIRVLDNLRNNVLKGTALKPIAGLNLYLSAIDHSGQACTAAGNEIIARIAAKLESDFQHLQSVRQTPSIKGIIGRVISRAGWLYSATPKNIVDHMRTILIVEASGATWKSAVEASGRAFVAVKDFRLLFEAIVRHTQDQTLGGHKFPEYAGRSICRILMFRKDGQIGLDSRMAQLFARLALERLRQEQERNNISRLYFQMIQLLFYLLRFRKTDPSCFDPNSPKSIFVFEEAKKSMEIAKSYLPRRSPKIGQIQKIIEGFDKYLHYEGTEEMITVLRDLAEGDD